MGWEQTSKLIALHVPLLGKVRVADRERKLEFHSDMTSPCSTIAQR